MFRATLAVTLALIFSGCGTSHRDEPLPAAVEGVTEATTPEESPAKATMPSDDSQVVLQHDPEESPRQVRGKIPFTTRVQPENMSFGEMLQEAVEGAENPPETKPPYVPPIDHLLNGLPDEAVPPWLDSGDSLGWTKLNNFVNSRMPQTLWLKVEIGDATFEPSEDGYYKPTIQLGPPGSGDSIICSYMERPAGVTISMDNPLDYHRFDSFRYPLPQVTEARAKRLKELKGQRAKLELAVTRAKLKPSTGYAAPATPFDPPTHTFVPDIELWVKYVRVYLPQGLEKEDPDVEEKPRYKGKCANCGKPVLSKSPLTRSFGMAFLGLDPEADKKLQKCPHCHMPGSLFPDDEAAVPVP